MTSGPLPTSPSVRRQVAGAAGALYSDGATLRSFAATFTSTSGPQRRVREQRVHVFTMDGSLSTPLGEVVQHQCGRWRQRQFPRNVAWRWSAAAACGLYLKQHGVFLAHLCDLVGSFSGGSYSGGPGSTINAPSATQPTMIGCWADITGPCILARENQGMPGEQVFQGMTWDGRSTVAISAGFSEILFGNQTVGMVNFSSAIRSLAAEMRRHCCRPAARITSLPSRKRSRRREPPLR